MNLIELVNGGILLLVRSDIHLKNMNLQTTNLRILATTVFLDNPINVHTPYFPPKDIIFKEYLAQIFDSIASSFIFMGDLKVHSLT